MGCQHSKGKTIEKTKTNSGESPNPQYPAIPNDRGENLRLRVNYLKQGDLAKSQFSIRFTAFGTPE